VTAVLMVRYYVHCALVIKLNQSLVCPLLDLRASWGPGGLEVFAMNLCRGLCHCVSIREVPWTVRLSWLYIISFTDDTSY